MLATETFGRDGSDVKCKTIGGLERVTKTGREVDVGTSHRVWQVLLENARMTSLMSCSVFLACEWSFAHRNGPEKGNQHPVAQTHEGACEI